MDITLVDPDLRKATEKLPTLDASNRFIRVAVRWAGQRLIKAHPVDGVSVRDVRDGPVRLRLYTPDETTTDAGLLWIHGGGLVIGSAKQDDRLCAETARELGMTVVSAEYRLAPEAPFPAALDDVHDVWSWTAANAPMLGIDPARIVLGGESAGGGLAATLAQRLLDENAPGQHQPLGQWLFCPMLDDRTAARRELDAVDHRVWNNKANRFGWASYLGSEPGGSSVPAFAVASRRHDLSGLPPAWVSVGDIELFYDEDVDYVERLRGAGVEAQLDIVPGAPHGFENWAADTPPARALVARAHEWLAGLIRSDD